MSQDDQKEEKNQSTCQKKVQSEGNCPAPTTYPTPNVPVNLIPAVPTPMVATTSTQMPMVKSAATSILY